jgi:hypothetical protein
MRSFDLSLRALNRSLLTRDQYLMSVGQMIDYFARHGGPTDPQQVTREHVEMFLADFAVNHNQRTYRPASRSSGCFSHSFLRSV